MAADTKITPAMLDALPKHQWWQIGLRNEKAQAEIEGLRSSTTKSKQRLDKRFADKVDKLRRGDELPPGVMKMVKVFVAVKRKLQPGDKMAGRHGNKGVISQIVPIEDMPHLGRRHAGRHRAQSAGRAEPHECRPDPGDPSRVGLSGSAGRSATCSTSSAATASSNRCASI